MGTDLFPLLCAVLFTFTQFCNGQSSGFIEGGLEGKGGNKITLQNYKAIEAAYAKEFMRAADGHEAFGSQVTYIQQQGTLTGEERELLSKYHMAPHEIDLSTSDQVSQNQFINNAYKEELDLYNDHLNKFETLTEDPLHVIPDHIRMILGKTMTIPRSHNPKDLMESTTVKDSVATYILHKFAALGYLTAVQKFTPKHFTHALPTHGNGDTVKGTNVIAIAPGTNFGTSADRILVIGAHWDTVSDSPGYNDNGSGMASMLEMARALKHADCKNVQTYIFVALDMEETGTQGAAAFVQEFLMRSIIKPMNFPEFQGAYILDSIANFNDTEDAQLLPETYQTQLPEFSAAVKQNGYKGDFIGVIGRKEDKPLYELFEFHWSKQPDTELKFKIQNMILPEELNRNFPEDSALTNNTNFLRSDHIRFWFANNKDYYASLKSVHISDTGPARGVMAECYHQFCDTVQLNETVPFANINFLKKITQAMIHTLIDATDSQCHKSTSEVSRLGRSLDATFNFIDKTRSADPQPQPQPQEELPTNDLGEPVINKHQHLSESTKNNLVTENNKSEVVRIEDLANVKLSEKQKNTEQSFPNSNEIQVLDRKTKPVKMYSKLIDKNAQYRPPFLAAADEPNITIREKISPTTNDLVRSGSEQQHVKITTPFVKQSNGHTGSTRNSFLDYHPIHSKISYDAPRSLTYELAGPYTTRANFQGPLFQPIAQGQNFAPVWSQNGLPLQPQLQFQKQAIYYQQPNVFYQQPITYQGPFVGQNYFMPQFTPFYPLYTHG